jgi:hypothetical protein
MGLKTSLEGDEKVKATVDASIAPVNDEIRIGSAIHLDYEFAVGWRYLCLQPTDPTSATLKGKPAHIGMYVKGDGTGDLLRMRFTDASGQTFQPDAGPIDWKGWRWVTMPLNNPQVGHWGGAADGVIHYPIHIDSLALVDSYAGRGNKGKVSLAGFTIGY